MLKPFLASTRLDACAIEGEWLVGELTFELTHRHVFYVHTYMYKH